MKENLEKRILDVKNELNKKESSNNEFLIGKRRLVDVYSTLAFIKQDNSYNEVYKSLEEKCMKYLKTIYNIVSDEYVFEASIGLLIFAMYDQEEKTRAYDELYHTLIFPFVDNPTNQQNKRSE